MTSTSPWDGISVPKSDLNVRHVVEKTAVPCYWGRNADGACLFIVELQGDHIAPYRKSNVRVTGIDIDLRAVHLEQQHLILTLERQVDRDLFESLCRTLARSLELATDSASALAISLTHIRRWKTFLAGRAQHLSEEEVRGLFAEITFLLELLDQNMSSITAVEAWLGPERSHQDFIFGNTAVEIKSLSGVERNTARISSEDQLESLNDSLFMRMYRLSSLSETPGARSLNEIVIAAHARIDEADALEAFDRKLVMHGYAPLPDYDQPHFVISEVHSYRVGDGFPRLIRSRLPTGITNVSYDIKLETLAPFECDGTALFKEV